MISIMQPYYLPFIGYFQLINKVDKFVIFNDIKFEKSGFFKSNTKETQRLDITAKLNAKNTNGIKPMGEYLLIGFNEKTIRLSILGSKRSIFKSALLK